MTGVAGGASIFGREPTVESEVSTKVLSAELVVVVVGFSDVEDIEN